MGGTLLHSSPAEESELSSWTWEKYLNARSFAIGCIADDLLSIETLNEEAEIYIHAVRQTNPDGPETSEILAGLNWLANKHCPAAYFALGAMYLEGSRVPHDKMQGLNYLLEAAKQGNSQAHYYLGCLHITGTLIEQDIVHGLILLNLAALHGNRSAHKKIATLQSTPPEDFEDDHLSLLHTIHLIQN